MTPDQIRLLFEYIDAAIAVAIEDHAGRDSGQEMLAESACREAVYASFGVNEDGTPLEIEEKPGMWTPRRHPVLQGYWQLTHTGSGLTALGRHANRELAQIAADKLNTLTEPGE